jgi:V/A-type H+-transporting ATPase subunit A
VQLVGLEALQDAERVVLESARLLREGFLRQSALLPADASSPPSKTLAMLRAFLHFHRRLGDAVGRGIPYRSLVEQDPGARLLRLAEFPPAEAPAAAEAAMKELDAALAALEPPT